MSDQDAARPDEATRSSAPAPPADATRFTEQPPADAYETHFGPRTTRAQLGAGFMAGAWSRRGW